MTMLALLIAPLLALQGAGETVVAVKDDTPETWTLEYPRLIQPYVQDYRRCLTGQMRRVTGEADFEAQHRADIPACAQARKIAINDAQTVLADHERYAEWTDQSVERLFDRMGAIHVARGVDLDDQFCFRIQAMRRARAQYEDTKPRGLVLELRDASVVKARTDATAPATDAINNGVK